MKKLVIGAALLALAAAGCISIARAAQGYLAISEWGIRWIPIARTNKPANCDSTRACTYDDTTKTPTHWNGTRDDTFVVASPSPGPFQDALCVVYDTAIGAHKYVPCVSGGGSGTVTNVATGTGLSGGPITGTGTISLADTAVTPGAYTSANITVDQQGRITLAANGTGGGVTVGNAVTSGTTNRVLYENSSNHVAESANLSFDGTTLTPAQLGATTLSGAVSIASGIDITAAGGASDLDMHLSSGIFKTPTGAATFGGSSNTFTGSIVFPATADAVTMPMVADAAVAQHCAVKIGTTADRVIQATVSDSAGYVVGFAATSAGGGGSTLSMVPSGFPATALSDGTTSIAVGDLVELSPNNDCYVRKGSFQRLGTAATACAASLGCTLTVR